MGLNSWLRNGLVTKGPLLFTVLILSITASAVYSLTLLDNLVHSTLYSYGLHFSYDWAAPYWIILRTIQALVSLIAVFTLTSTIYVYRKHILAKPEIKTTTIEKPVAHSFAMKPHTGNVVATCPKCGTEENTPKKKWTMTGRADKTGKRMQLDIGLFDCPKCTNTFRVVLSKQKV